MQVRAYSVADELPYHRVTTHLDIPLYRRADIADPIAGHRRPNALVQAFPGGVKQRLRLGRNIPAGEGGGVIAVVTVKKRAHVHADDVAGVYHAFARYAVDDLVIDRNTGAGRKAAIPEERGLRPRRLDVLADAAVDFPGGDTGLHRLTGQFQRSGRDDTRFPHGFQIPAAFYRYHAQASIAARVRRVVSATSSWPSTITSLPQAA